MSSMFYQKQSNLKIKITVIITMLIKKKITLNLNEFALIIIHKSDVLLDMAILVSWFGVGQSDDRQALIRTLPVTKAPWNGPE